MPAILHTCHTVLLLLSAETHITVIIHQKSIYHDTYLSYYCKYMHTNKYAPSNAKNSYIPKLLNVHLLGKCANIYAICEVTTVNDVVRITVLLCNAGCGICQLSWG